MSFFTRLFKFRIFKFRTTLSEELDDLHIELINLQQNLTQTRLLQKQWTKWFAIYAILAYLVVNISYYTFFLSRDFVNRVYAFTISVALGVFIICCSLDYSLVFSNGYSNERRKIGVIQRTKTRID